MIYTIWKNWHYSLHFPRLHFGRTHLKVKFRMLDGCWFAKEVPDDFAINKLVGLGWGNHHKNSARLGWTDRKEPGRINLFFYLYLIGKRYEYPFDTIEIGLQYEFEMDLEDGVIYFKLVKPDGIIAERYNSYSLPKFRYGAILMPYCGGALAARIDTYIDLEFV